MMFPRAAALAATIVTVACGGGGGFPDAGPTGDAARGGTLSLGWSLVKMADGTPISCDQVGALTVTLVLRNRAMQGGFTEVFSCNTRMGTTPAVPAGTYDVNFELSGVNGLISTSAEQRGLVVTAGNTTALAPVTFTVNAIGALDLRIDALDAGGNCGGGAGITDVTITLNHASGGACEPVTLSIGGAPYTINCNAPQSVGCIEKTTAITATNVPTDNYVIHIRGSAPGKCFVNDDSLRVPPNAMTLTRTLSLAETATACP